MIRATNTTLHSTNYYTQSILCDTIMENIANTLHAPQFIFNAPGPRIQTPHFKIHAPCFKFHATHSALLHAPHGIYYMPEATLYTLHAKYYVGREILLYMK